jgi:aryl-alcohol dehydrogenase-like predicted oxidoreductase
MEFRSLGRTGLRVSRLALGTVNFGRLLTPRESFDLLDRAVDTGINLVDTADEYANGLTERIIGEWLGQAPARRRQIVLATKVYETVDDGPNDGGLSAYHIRRACEGSLRRLRTDHIDLYQMHHIDRGTPWEGIWQAMEQLVRPAVTSILIGSRTAEHLQSSLDALDDRLSPELIELLDGIFPGPGGAAPEAYAW